MIGALLGLSGGAAGSGCSARVDFEAPDVITDGITGKTWKTPIFVDAPLYSPRLQNTSALTQGFDAAVYGSTVQLAASLYDPLTSSTYRGYARRYTEAGGWASFGPHFGQIAIDGTRSFASVSLGVDPSGVFMANLFSSANGASASYSSDGGWTLATNNTPPAHLPLAGVVSAMDAQGRGFVFLADSATSVVWESLWDASTTTGLSPSFNQVSATAARANSSQSAFYDGSSRVCVLYENAAARLLSGCEDVSSTATPDFASSEARTVSVNVAGHAVATDGAGGMAAIVYRGTGTNYHVYASIGSSGAWPSSVTLIDDQDDDFTAPWPSGTYAISGARPGVAHIGGGRYLAVWVGVNDSSSPPATRLYSNLYDPGAGGWQGAEMIAGTEDSFGSVLGTPHPRSITVFSNGDGNAGYALNKIHTSDNIGGTNAGSTPAIYPEAAGVRVLEVNRWQEDLGWVGAQTFTDFPCFNAYDETSPWLAAAGVGTNFECTHAPIGLMLPSGSSMVFFQAVDGLSSGLVPGNRRIAVTHFN